MADIDAGVALAFSTQGAMRNISNINNSFNGLTSTIKKVGYAAATYLSFKALKETVGGVITSGMDAENQLVKLETAVGDAAKAFDLYQQAVERADKTPFETDEVVDAVVKLQAYGIPAFEQIGKTGVDTFTAVGNMAGAMGKSLSQSMEAIADAVTGEMERLKEFGITVSMLPPKLRAMERGSAAFKQGILEYIATLPRFSGGMVKMSQTMSGLLSTIRGFWSNFVRMISGVGDIMAKRAKVTTFYDAIKEAITSFMNFLMQNRDAIMNFARTIGQVLRAVWAVVGTILKFIGGAIQNIIGSFTSWWDAMGEGDEAFKVFSTKVAAFTTFIEILFEDMGNVLRPIFQSISRLAGTMFEGIKGYWIGLSDVLATEMPALLKNIGSMFADLVSYITPSEESIGKFTDSMVKMGSAVGNIISGIVDIFSWVFTQVKAFIEGIIDGFSAVSGIKDAWDALMEAVSELVKVIRSLFNETKPIHPLFYAIGKVIGWVIGTAFKILIWTLTAVVVVVRRLIHGVVELIRGFKEIGLAIATFFTNLWEGGKRIIEIFREVWDTIRLAGAMAFDYIIDKWTGIKNFFMQIGTWISQPFIEAWNWIQMKITDFVNWFLDKYNWMADTFIGKQLGIEKVSPVQWGREATTGAATTTVTHTSSAVIHIHESANPQDTAAYVVNFMNRRFAEGK